MNIHPLIQAYWEQQGYTIHKWTSMSGKSVIFDANKDGSWCGAIAIYYANYRDHPSIQYRSLFDPLNYSIPISNNPLTEQEVLRQLKLLPFT